MSKKKKKITPEEKTQARKRTRVEYRGHTAVQATTKDACPKCTKPKPPEGTVE